MKPKPHIYKRMRWYVKRSRDGRYLGSYETFAQAAAFAEYFWKRELPLELSRRWPGWPT
jgi:hypothetical protein